MRSYLQELAYLEIRFRKITKDQFWSLYRKYKKQQNWKELKPMFVEHQYFKDYISVRNNDAIRKISKQV